MSTRTPLPASAMFPSAAPSRRTPSPFTTRSTILKSRPTPRWRASAAKNYPKGYPAVRGHRLQSRPGRQAQYRPTISNWVRVDADWSLEEFYAVFGDDDKEFVGTLSPVRILHADVEGPNPKRKFSRNNYGDVWVVATYKGAQEGRQAARRANPTWWSPCLCTFDGMTGGGRSEVTFLGSANSMRFEGGGRQVLYLVPSAGIFELDDTARAVLDAPVAGRSDARRACRPSPTKIRSTSCIKSRAIVSDGSDSADQSHRTRPPIFRCRRWS